MSSPLMLQRNKPTGPSPSNQELLSLRVGPGSQARNRQAGRALLRRGRLSTSQEDNESKEGSDMNWNQIEGNWEQFKGKVQTQWGKLTNDDLDVIKGNRKQLAGRLQERYGKAQDAVERDIDDWLSRH